MSRDEDIRALLGLFREGRMGEDELVARISAGVGREEAVNGESPPSVPSAEEERHQLAALLDSYRAAEASGADTISSWAARTRDQALAGGLRVVAAREAAHADQLERRARELGHEPIATVPQWLLRYNTSLLDEAASDEERLERVVRQFPDIEGALAPLRERIVAIHHDDLTRELLRAIADDEEATLRWMHAARSERVAASKR